LFLWFLTLNRGLIYFSQPKLFLPRGEICLSNYHTGIVFSGFWWLALLLGASKGLRLGNAIPATVYVLMLLAFDAYAIASIYQYISAPL